MKKPLFSFRKENMGKLKISKLTHFLLGDFPLRKTTLMLLDRQKKTAVGAQSIRTAPHAPGPQTMLGLWGWKCMVS